MAFPTTPILDDFNRADEGPPPSASWHTPGFPGDYDGLRVVSNQMTTDAGSIGGYSDWNTSYGPDCEFYFTIPNLLANNPSVIFYFRLDAPYLEGTTKGYSLDIISGQVNLIRLSDSASLHTEVMAVSSGDKFGVSAVGDLLTVYYDGGGGWAELFNATDSDYTGAGYAAFFLDNILSNSPSNTIDDFGGGTLAAPPAPPVADFSATPTSGTVALSVDFTDLTTNTPTSWYWDFGDGGSSTSQNPTHVYNYIGTYTVNLTATNALGSDIETKVAYITVTAVVEYGPAEIENCDVDTGGAAVGLRVADVAIARDNIFGSVTIDASAELRAKDNAYDTLTNNGTLTSLGGDRSAWDTTNFAALHARDIDEATGTYHLVSAVTQTYTISNPSTDRAYDVTGLTLNELAAVVGTLIADLQAKGLLS